MQVHREKLYFCLENKPPDERAETGSPTVYEFVHREVFRVSMGNDSIWVHTDKSYLNSCGAAMHKTAHSSHLKV